LDRQSESMATRTTSPGGSTGVAANVTLNVSSASRCQRGRRPQMCENPRSSSVCASPETGT
jgi:hypothetical protein